MGFLDWLGRLFAGSSPRSHERRSPGFTTEPNSTSAFAGSVPPPRPVPSQAPPYAANAFDLTAFAPISSDEMHAAAKKLGSRVADPFLGRVDLIPPADDPRTHLIERAMVTHGFITPAELAEIHEVGARMDAVRPDPAIVRRQMARERDQDAAARAVRKEQLKAAAAARRAEHAAAVAHRRATDIVFLGRGVSAGLADRRSDVEALEKLGLPVLATPADVAAILELDIKTLRWLTFHSDASPVTHYVRFDVPKRSGGTRTLSSPHPKLAACQEWVLRNVLDALTTHDAAHGFVRGRSTATNAAPHVGRAVVLNADLSDFFPTITFPRVRGLFRSLGYSPAVATVLALLCTAAPRRPVTHLGETLHVAAGDRALPQGACTSPAISNLVCRRMDARLAGIATKLDWTYTRYADDITFSAEGDAAERIGYVLARLRHIASDEGFAVNEKKTRIQKRNARQSVTGIVVNEHLNVPRPTVRRLRAILHRARTEGLASQNREEHPNFEGWVRGMIAYVNMVNPKQGAALLRDLEALS